MEILIVEDNENKLKNVKLFLQSRYADANLSEAHSFNAGRKKLFEQDWDLVILDMSLPTYDITYTENGGDKKPVAGKNIIKRMKHRGVNFPTVVLTQFESFDDEKISLETLNRELAEEYGDIWKGTIYYSSDDWESELSELLDKIDI